MGRATSTPHRRWRIPPGARASGTLRQGDASRHRDATAPPRVRPAGQRARRRVARDRLAAAEEQVRRAEGRSGRPVAARPAASRARRTARRRRSAAAARRPPPAPSIPRSITLTITCSIALRMRFDPAEPSDQLGRHRRRSTTVGAIIDGSRAPGRLRWKPSGERSSSPSTLLRWMPVPGTTTPEPSPFELVTAHAQPSASSTDTCVVDPSRFACPTPPHRRARPGTPACAPARPRPSRRRGSARPAVRAPGRARRARGRSGRRPRSAAG